MKKLIISLGMVIVMTLTLALPVSAAGSVQPSEVYANLAAGESMVVEKTITTPEIPLVVDILLLQDETGSMGNDIGYLQALATTIWTNLESYEVDFQMGVAGFKDFAVSPWGLPPGEYTIGGNLTYYGGDWVYRLLQDITGTESDFTAGVNELEAMGGNDNPEAQLEALHYLSTVGHAAIDSDGNSSTADDCDTPAGQQPSWRSGAQKVVLLATDAPCHKQGDLPSPGWPGCAETANVSLMVDFLNAAGITVVGLVPDGATIPCITELATGTGGTVQDTGDGGEDIAAAIIAGLEALTTDVWGVVTACDAGLSVTLDPIVIKDVSGGSTVYFQETITVMEDAEQCGTLEAEVTFYANSYDDGEGTVIGTETIGITVLDTTAPVVSCVEAGNPRGKNVPPAGSTTMPGPSGGRNDDGFYMLLAEDNCDDPEDIMIYVSGFGPFSSGDVVKITEAPGAEPRMKPMGSENGQADGVVAHIIIPSDPVLEAVDSSGNVGTCTGCLVPPLPK